MDEKLLRIISADKERTKLVLEKKYKSLIKTYHEDCESFLDQNTKEFWQTKIFNEINNDFATLRRIEIVIKEIGRCTNKSLLDVGVGQAYLERCIAKRKKKITLSGVDILDEASYKGIPNFEYSRVIDYKRLPFINNRFGVVTCLEVLEHIKPRDVFLVLGELRRVLRKDGTLIVSVPVNENLKEISSYDKQRKKYINPNSHLRDYNKTLISWELSYCGFEVNKIYETVAFKRFGSPLTFINLILKRWKPNNLVLVARKK